MVRRAGPVLVLDLIEQSDEIATLHVLDLAATKTRIDKASKPPLAFLHRAELPALTAEVVLGDALQGIGRRCCLLATLGQRIAALGHLTEYRPSLLAGLSEF